MIEQPFTWHHRQAEVLENGILPEDRTPMAHLYNACRRDIIGKVDCGCQSTDMHDSKV
jgi:hypothetical protein